MTAENKPKYVHFEGMDLAGKSLAAKNLIERSNESWQIRRNSINLDNPIFELADSMIKSKDTKYSSETLGNLYIAALMADIESFSRPSCNTIQDSTIILRSLAYHTVNGTPRIAEVMTELLLKHPKFDFSFVLTADLQTRQSRLEKRFLEAPQEISLNDQMIIRNPKKFMDMNNCLIDLAVNNFHSIVIDTSDKSPAEVTDILMLNVYNK